MQSQVKIKEVKIGSIVTVKYDDGYVATFKIVQSGDKHTGSKYINSNAPISKAVLGHKEQDDIKFRISNIQEIKCKILKIGN